MKELDIILKAHLEKQGDHDEETGESKDIRMHQGDSALPDAEEVAMIKTFFSDMEKGLDKIEIPEKASNSFQAPGRVEKGVFLYHFLDKYVS